MSIKQNLDSFFQEKLQNVEYLPDASVWIEIDARLNQNKTKVVTNSNWIKYTAVAAVFMLSGLLGLNTNQSFKTENWVASKKSVAINSKLFYHNKLDTNYAQLVWVNAATKNSSTKPILVTNDASKSVKQKSIIFYKESKELRQSASKINTNTTAKLSNASSSLSNKVIGTKTNSNIQIKTASIAYKNQQIPINDSQNKKALYKTPPFLISNDSIQLVTQITSQHANTNKIAVISNTHANQTQTDLQDNTDNSNKYVAKTEFVGATDKASNDSLKLSINRVAYQIDSLKIKKNSNLATEALVAAQKPNDLQQPKKPKKNNLATTKWQITSTIAPIYFGSTANGSPLDKKFIDNEKSFNTSQSYGLGINYAVSSKIKIRIGIHSINLDYDTKNIAYEINNSSGAKLTNLSANNAGQSVSIDNIKNNAIFGRTSNSSELLSDASNTGTLNQKIGYIELPLELSYKIGGSKFNIDLITGVSTYYLQQNTVSLKTVTNSITIGEASNLNQYHFSGNLGLGLNYNIIRNFSASIEPTFKYQVNTFTNNAGNFKPYVFGIYSGIKYNF